MSSKTARSSAVKEVVKAKQVIPDDELIRLLRIDLNAGIYPSPQMATAALRSFDGASQVAVDLGDSLVASNNRVDELVRRNEELIARNNELADTLTKVLFTNSSLAKQLAIFNGAAVGAEELPQLPASDAVTPQPE